MGLNPGYLLKSFLLYAKKLKLICKYCKSKSTLDRPGFFWVFNFFKLTKLISLESPHWIFISLKCLPLNTSIFTCTKWESKFYWFDFFIYEKVLQIFINPEKNITAEQICSTNFDHYLFIMFPQWSEFFTEEAFILIMYILAFSQHIFFHLLWYYK